METPEKLELKVNSWIQGDKLVMCIAFFQRWYYSLAISECGRNKQQYKKTGSSIHTSSNLF